MRKKNKEEYYHESCSSSDSDGESDKQSKARVRAEQETLSIPVSELPLHLSVPESKGVAATSIADWVKQS